MRTNLLKKIAKYYDMMHVIFSLLDATYGAFRPTESVYALVPSDDVSNVKNIRLLGPKRNSDLKDVDTLEELGDMMEDVDGFSEDEMEHYLKIIQDTAHLILEFSRCGGFENASGF